LASQAYRFIGVEAIDLVTVITIDRPEVLNALHLDADRELDLALSASEADVTQRVAIITGAGERAFSAGNDLKEQACLGTRQLLPSGFGALTSRTTLEKPIIAAVNGLALGGLI
jgi:enoyl-CoA hydratase/carnithine racemase